MADTGEFFHRHQQDMRRRRQEVGCVFGAGEHYHRLRTTGFEVGLQHRPDAIGRLAGVGIGVADGAGGANCRADAAALAKVRVHLYPLANRYDGVGQAAVETACAARLTGARMRTDYRVVGEVTRLLERAGHPLEREQGRIDVGGLAAAARVSRREGSLSKSGVCPISTSRSVSSTWWYVVAGIAEFDAECTKVARCLEPAPAKRRSRYAGLFGALGEQYLGVQRRRDLRGQPVGLLAADDDHTTARGVGHDPGGRDVSPLDGRQREAACPQVRVSSSVACGFDMIFARPG